MTSSPTTTPPVESAPTSTDTGLAPPRLLDLLTTVDDPRKRRGIRHPVTGILTLALAAVLAGARSFTAIGEWVADADPDVLADAGVPVGRRPSEATIRRVLGRMDTERLDALLGAWMRTRVGHLAGRRVIAIDGKSVRGARTTTSSAPHLVAALDHLFGVVLGQVEVTEKSNEITALRRLLGAFDLFDTVVTADAMHTQAETAWAITGRGGHYVFTVKGNQKGLFTRCKALPWSKIRSTSRVETGHGRRVRRTIKVTTAPEWLDFPAAVQVAQIRRTRTKHGVKSVEVVYVITSMSSRDASPEQIAAWVQGHWGIENRLHWVRDVTFDEDRSTVRSGSGPRCMAILRSTVISVLRLAGETCIASALRYHARDHARPIGLLLAC